MGEEELALSLYDESIEAAHAAGEGKAEANSHFNKAESLARLHRIDEAIAAMHTASRIYKSLGLRDAEDADRRLERLKTLNIRTPPILVQFSQYQRWCP